MLSIMVSCTRPRFNSSKSSQYAPWSDGVVVGGKCAKLSCPHSVRWDAHFLCIYQLNQSLHSRSKPRDHWRSMTILILHLPVPRRYSRRQRMPSKAASQCRHLQKNKEQCPECSHRSSSIGTSWRMSFLMHSWRRHEVHSLEEIELSIIPLSR